MGLMKTRKPDNTHAEVVIIAKLLSRLAAASKAHLAHREKQGRESEFLHPKPVAEAAQRPTTNVSIAIFFCLRDERDSDGEFPDRLRVQFVRTTESFLTLDLSPIGVLRGVGT